MKRVVVTGLGAVTPLGNDVASTWEALVQGRSGIARITAFDPSPFEVQIAGEVKDFHPEEHIPHKELRRMDRNSQMGIVAALQSVQDAGLRLGDGDGRRAGVVFASGTGGVGTIIEQQKILEERGPRRVSPFFLANMLADSASGHIAIMLGATGPNMAVVSSCSTGTGSIGEAMETIRRGDADVVVSGATEATVLPLFMAGFHALRALASNNAEPHRACRPFDLTRDGFVVGEGAASLVLESLEHAEGRGARIYAEVIGYGSSADAYDMVASEESGRGPINSMDLALAKAGIDRDEVDYVNAHGTGTPMNDRVETAAIKSVFGEHAYGLAVSSTKSMTGHLMGAAGAVEALATVLALHNQTIPPTINYEVPDPDCDLDYVPNTARPTALRVVMSNSIGLGGHCASVLFRHYPP